MRGPILLVAAFAGGEAGLRATIARGSESTSAIELILSARCGLIATRPGQARGLQQSGDVTTTPKFVLLTRTRHDGRERALAHQRRDLSQ
jgi:hypothetical protein